MLRFQRPKCEIRPAENEQQWQRAFIGDLSEVRPGRLNKAELINSKGELRFSLVVCDPKTKPAAGRHSCATFLTPQGCEQDYMFNHPDGIEELANSSGFSRLIVVHLERGQKFKSAASIQDELREYMLKLSPRKRTGPMPYLTASDGIGERHPVSTIETKHSGKVEVEDIKQDDRFFRRMVFLSTRLVQSEARLAVGAKPGDPAARVDPGYLSCAYQPMAVAGLTQLTKPPAIGALLGVGAGSLATFVTHVFPSLQLFSVDIDPEVPALGQRYFSFNTSDRLRLVTADALDWVAQLNQRLSATATATATPTASAEPASTDAQAQQTWPSEKLDFIILDINSTDLSEGLSFPPAAFVSAPVLQQLRSALKSEDSALIINLGCRNLQLKNEILQRCVSVFDKDGDRASVLRAAAAPGEDVNEIVVCLNPAATTVSAAAAAPATVEERKAAARQRAEAWFSAPQLQVDASMGLARKAGLFTVVAAEKPAVEETKIAAAAEGAEPTMTAEERRRAKEKARKAKQKARKKAAGKPGGAPATAAAAAAAAGAAGAGATEEGAADAAAAVAATEGVEGSGDEQ